MLASNVENSTRVNVNDRASIINKIEDMPGGHFIRFLNHPTVPADSATDVPKIIASGQFHVFYPALSTI
jgi:hypothetical protein